LYCVRAQKETFVSLLLVCFCFVILYDILLFYLLKISRYEQHKRSEIIFVIFYRRYL